MPELSLRDRRAAVEHLQRLSDELAAASAWLAGFGPDEDKASIMVEEAWKATAAACWTLGRANRTRQLAGWATPSRACGLLTGPVTAQTGQPLAL